MMNNSIFFSLQPSECETVKEDEASSGGGGGGATYVFQVSKDLSASPCEKNIRHRLKSGEPHICTRDVPMTLPLTVKRADVVCQIFAKY